MGSHQDQGLGGDGCGGLEKTQQHKLLAHGPFLHSYAFILHKESSIYLDTKNRSKDLTLRCLLQNKIQFN